MLRKDDHSTQELSQRGSKNGPRVGVIGSYDEHPTMKLLNRLLIIVTIVGLATMLIPVRRLEGDRIIQISSAFNCRFLGPNSP